MRPRYAALFAALLFAPTAFAQVPGSCERGQAVAELSVSDVRARLFNTGGLFWRGGAPVYEVPKDGGVTPLFVANLWVGGRVGGEVRTAAAIYADWEFWPGPLDDGAVLPDPDDCSPFDRFYRVSAPELAVYDAGGHPSTALTEWPVGLGAPAVDANGDPVMPTSREQTVDLEAGERPVVYGSETIFWVMNDVGNVHETTDSAPLGIEVRVSAFSINDPNAAALDQATLYRYEVINRSSNAIDDFYLGVFQDNTLGYAQDDYIGMDVNRGMWYVYNADDDDERDRGGYGTAPPAFGVDILSGASSSMAYVGNSNPISGNPVTASDYYNYLTSRWRTGQPITRGGDGTSPSRTPTTWMYDGDPTAVDPYWSGRDLDPDPGLQPDQPSNREGLVAATSTDLAPGASHTVDIALVFARGVDHLDSITELRAASDLIQARYDDGSLFDATSGDLGPPPAAAPALLSPEDGTAFTPPQIVLIDWTPVPDATSYRIEFADNPAFTGASFRDVPAPPLDVVFSDLPMGNEDPIYWRVAGANASGTGPASEARAFTYAFTFAPGVATLSDGQPAFLEVAGPGGADPCGSGATSTFGCAEAGGNAVFVGDDRDGVPADANGTGQYALFSRGGFADALTSTVAPREIEVRFTAGGSVATHLFGEGVGGETHRVPFEVWDIGIVPLGADGVPAANDPADDVRLVPVLFSDDAGDGTGTCAFAFGEIAASESGSGFSLTDRIYGFYPTTTYADFEIAAAPLVDAAPDGCYLDADGALADRLDANRGRALERIVIADLTGSGSVADLDGAVIRFHTTDPQPVSDEAAPTAEALALAVIPNPSRGAARVRFSLAEPGTVRVRVLDVLGREVAVVAEGERRAEAHEVALPGGLAAGVYVVAVEASGERVARTFTVVR